MNEEEILQVAKQRVESKLYFYKHLFVYIAVIFLLFVINYRTSPDYYWFVWPLLGWGVAVVIHAVKVFSNAERSKIKAEMLESEVKKLRDKEN
jgi:biopolymer transport protein ExbB/TolQ